MIKYYYVTNKDGTTFNGFKPFENNADYAEAPDWIDDDRECGYALHVVSDNPCKALSFVVRDHPIAHEVEPIDLKLEMNDKFRCRALKKIRTLSDDEFVNFFMKFKPSENKANLAIDNGSMSCLNRCIEMGILPTIIGANYAARYGRIEFLNRCIEIGILPTSDGADWATHNGHLNTLNRCIEIEVFPTSDGANWAANFGHLDCLNRCIEIGIRPTFHGANLAYRHGQLDCLNRCVEIGVLPTDLGS